ncbi:hypothetical protein ACFLX7_01955, partial [Chloroflexota bacterium]
GHPMCCQGQSEESCDREIAFACSVEDQESPVAKSNAIASERGFTCRRAKLLGLDLLKSFEKHS